MKLFEIKTNIIKDISLNDKQKDKKLSNSNQDWIGNYKSIYTTLGASNHTDKEREKHDYYATDSIAIDALLEKATLNLNLWECACGEGHLSKRLIELGYNVKSTDLIDRGFGQGGINFLKCYDKFDGDIITNPPYVLAYEFIEHALALIPNGRKVFMFLKLQFLEGKSRRVLFDKGYLKTLYVSSSRILCAKNGDFDSMRKSGGSAVAYGWYEFEKGYNGKPYIEWIN